MQRPALPSPTASALATTDLCVCSVAPGRSATRTHLPPWGGCRSVGCLAANAPRAPDALWVRAARFAGCAKSWLRLCSRRRSVSTAASRWDVLSCFWTQESVVAGRRWRSLARSRNATPDRCAGDPGGQRVIRRPGHCRAPVATVDHQRRHPQAGPSSDSRRGEVRRSRRAWPSPLVVHYRRNHQTARARVSQHPCWLRAAVARDRRRVLLRRQRARRPGVRAYPDPVHPGATRVIRRTTTSCRPRGGRNLTACTTPQRPPDAGQAGCRAAVPPDPGRQLVRWT